MFSVTLQSVRPQVMSFTVPAERGHLPDHVLGRQLRQGGTQRASKSSEGASGVGAGEAVGSRSSGG